MNTGEWKERVRGYTRAGVRKAIMMGLIAVMATVFGVSPLVAQTKNAETFGVMERRRAESTVEDVFKYQVIDNLKYRKFGALYDNVAFTYVWTRADFIKDMERMPPLSTSWETVRDIEAKAIYPWRVDVTAKIGYKDDSGMTRFKTVTVQFRQYDDNNALTPHGGVWKMMAGDLILLLPRR